MQNYNNLEVFEEAKQLAVDIYKLTRLYPKDEVFGLVQQLRRGIVSVGANIAEGSGRKSNADFLRFLHNSMGSLKEVEFYLTLSKELNYLDDKEYQNYGKRIGILGRRLNSLMQKVSPTELQTTNHKPLTSSSS